MLWATGLDQGGAASPPSRMDAGVHLVSPEIFWFFFSIGLVFWLVLLAIVLYRLFFHEHLPARLAPTLFILLAPPSVGFITYTQPVVAIIGAACNCYPAVMKPSPIPSGRPLSCSTFSLKQVARQ